MDGWGITANYLYNLMTLKRSNWLKSQQVVVKFCSFARLVLQTVQCTEWFS